MDVERAADAAAGLIRWWPAFALLLVVGLAVAVMVHPGPLPGEIGYVRWLQDLDEPVPTLANVVRFTTATEAALIVAAVASVWLLGRCARHGAVVIAIAAVTMLVVQPVVKEIVDRPRPAPQLVAVRAAVESMSFPSGHSMSTTTVWGAIAGAAWVRRRRNVAAATAALIVPRLPPTRAGS